MNTFQTICAVVQGLTAIFTFAILLIKPFRKWLLGVKDRTEQNAADERMEREAVLCLIRSEIVRIFYLRKDDRNISQYEYENVLMLFDAYKKLGGNSFVKQIIEDMGTWNIQR